MKRTILIVAWLLSSLGLPATGQEVEDIAPVFEDSLLLQADSLAVETPLAPELQGAVAAMEMGDYVAASVELQGLVLQDSTHLQALRLLASAYSHLEAHVQATQVCEQIAALDSLDAGLRVVLGFLHQEQGDFEPAQAYYLQALEMDANLVQAYQGLGWIYLQRRQLQQAHEMATKTAERAPNYAPNYILLGRVLTAQGFFENAKRVYEQAFALDPQLRERYGILLQELVLRHRLAR